MWLFTPFGFFSVVEIRRDPERLFVRARVRADLVALLKRIGARTPIHRTPDADYPYRVVLPRETVAQAVADFVREGLRYPNFKDEVLRRQGSSRELAYHDVWTVMRGIEDDGARSATPPAPVAGSR